MPRRPPDTRAAAAPAVPVAVTHDGLSCALFWPDGPPAGGVIVLHGAGSSWTRHADFAARCRTAGLAALAFDMRGHGATGGRLDGRALADVAAMAAVLRAHAGQTLPIGLRGSSMGGLLALLAAERAGARAVVAVCPAAPAALRQGLRGGRVGFEADEAALDALLDGADDAAAATALGARLLLMHAQEDEVVPVAHSRALHAAAPGSQLVEVPGGHHRSIQHDPAWQDASVRFLSLRLGTPPA